MERDDEILCCKFLVVLEEKLKITFLFPTSLQQEPSVWEQIVQLRTSGIEDKTFQNNKFGPKFAIKLKEEDIIFNN